MSKIQGTPFVNKVLKTLTDNQKLFLASLINGSNDDPVFRSLINPANYINNDDKDFVKHIILEAQDQTFTGYLVYNDTYCVLFAYDKKKQSIDVVNIDNVKKTYEFVREHLTILELRFSLEEEKESVDVKQIVQDAIEDGEIEVSNENVITVNAVDLSTGSTNKVLSNADWILATDNTKGCTMVLKLVAQNVYPLGSEIELKRVSIDDNLVKFAMTFNYPNDTKYITYIVTGIFAPTGGTISVTELEANKGTVPAGAPTLTDLTLGGQTYKVDGVIKTYYAALESALSSSNEYRSQLTFQDNIMPTWNESVIYVGITFSASNDLIALDSRFEYITFVKQHDRGPVAGGGKETSYWQGTLTIHNSSFKVIHVYTVTIRGNDEGTSFTISVKEIPDTSTVLVKPTTAPTYQLIPTIKTDGTQQNVTVNYDGNNGGLRIANGNLSLNTTPYSAGVNNRAQTILAGQEDIINFSHQFPFKIGITTSGSRYDEHWETPNYGQGTGLGVLQIYKYLTRTKGLKVLFACQVTNGFAFFVKNETENDITLNNFEMYLSMTNPIGTA